MDVEMMFLYSPWKSNLDGVEKKAPNLDKRQTGSYPFVIRKSLEVKRIGFE